MTGERGGVRFDAFAAQHPNQSLATWTVWAGPGSDRPAWALTASPHVPSSLLADLSGTLATGSAPARPPPRRPHATRTQGPHHHPSHRQRPAARAATLSDVRLAGGHRPRVHGARPLQLDGRLQHAASMDDEEEPLADRARRRAS
ncbi:DUF317 domain-containing protein [Streptomyces sp. NPDC051310]|uniref:DUF317 domain-containing protein n=1 Tax=Streptomyces sp. NPDC051310 TaxID=3365649 RepID=UPI003790A6CA